MRPVFVLSLLVLVAGAGCTPRAEPAASGGVPNDAAVPSDAVVPSHLVLRGGRLPGGAMADVEMRAGRIVAVGRAIDDADVVDVSGRYIAPAFIDSHVHLAYLPLADQMVAGGIAGAVDLAAPESFLAIDHGLLEVRASGPMITSPGGYPLDSWGQDGFGLGCADAESAVLAVDHLKALGAALIKVPLTDPPGLDDAIVRAIVERAHAVGLKVAVHALSEDAARRGAQAGADVLAHTPVEALTDSTLATWANRAVIGTLHAFGGSFARENLSRLRAAGAIVLYGTDFGNTTTTGIDGREIDELAAAGLDGAAILAAGTSSPALFWGFSDLGSIEVGKAGSVLVVAEDPLSTPGTLANPVAVYVRGVAAPMR